MRGMREGRCHFSERIVTVNRVEGRTRWSRVTSQALYGEKVHGYLGHFLLLERNYVDKRRPS